MFTPEIQAIKNPPLGRGDGERKLSPLISMLGRSALSESLPRHRVMGRVMPTIVHAHVAAIVIANIHCMWAIGFSFVHRYAPVGEF